MEMQAAQNDPIPSKSKILKKRGTMHFLRSVLHKIRGRSHRKSAPVHSDAPINSDTVRSVEKGGTWKSLMGALRPLHHLPRSQPPSPVLSTASSSIRSDNSLEDAVLPPMDADGKSRYASAKDLKELDIPKGEAEGGEEDINVKAEEFIAKFYEEFRLQRSASTNSVDDERMEIKN